MKQLILILFVGLFCVSCNQKSNQAQVSEEVSMEEPTTPEVFPELEGGEVRYKKKNPFGETVELTGKQFVADTVIFKLRETTALVNESKLVLKNLGGEAPFLVFDFPSFTFSGYKGRYGNGPDEFISPELVTTNDTSLLCYLFERTNEKLYQLDKTGAVIRYPFDFKESISGRYSAKDYITNIGPDEFMYVDNSTTGKSIFRAYKENDSIRTTEVFSLNLNPKRKGWANYIGDFAVNPAKNRMVYAYKYFKILKFMDMEAHTVKMINFEKEEFDEDTAYKIDGMDANVTHYWGICAQDDYVYCLYSGRTPQVVGTENVKGNHYIYVEQYDWNGTPIRTYKLDQWGYFFVNEKTGKLFLMTYYEDDPFFEYQLPQN